MTKSQGAVRAVDGLNLTVAAGETVALLGPNGAGTVEVFSDPPERADAAGR